MQASIGCWLEYIIEFCLKLAYPLVTSNNYLNSKNNVMCKLMKNKSLVVIEKDRKALKLIRCY